MYYITGATTPKITPRAVSYGRLGFFNRLFRQYCDSFQPLADFYQFDYRSSDGRRKAAEAAAAHPRDRSRLVEVLHEQNSRWGAGDATRQNIERLASAETVAVVTGQQLGLFTGPLYTIYKTITVLQMTRKLAAETGREVVPVFWLEAEDHDFDEISSISVLAGNKPRTLTYSGHAAPAQGNRGPVGRLVLSPEIESTLNALDEALPPTDFKPQLMDAVRASYQPGATILDAFAGLMTSLFENSGLILMAPDDRRLKELVRPLFERELRDPEAVATRVERATEKLRKPYHAQVTVRPSNLFFMDEAGRHPLDVVDGSLTLRGTSRRMTQQEALAALEADPSSFSANVVLRPLVQDTLLPTAIYVAGPSEVAYFAQFKGVYEWAGLPMPAIYPRASATLVEGKVKKVLDAYDLTIADVEEKIDAVFGHVLKERLDIDVDGQFGNASRHLHQAVDQMRPFLEEVDRTLIKSAEATRSALLKEFDKFRHRVVKAEKRKHEQVRLQLEKAQVNLFPYGHPQERSISVLYFLNKYGRGVLPALEEVLPLDTGCHQALMI